MTIEGSYDSVGRLFIKPTAMTSAQLPYLDTFVKAAELNSFTAAARVLGFTQAAVSQRIGALEQILRVALFERQGGHLLLTQAGQRLYSFAERILALEREAIKEITGRKPPLAGELILGASSVPGEHLLPDLLSVFHGRYAHIRVRATVTDTRHVLDQVEKGLAHVGLVGAKTENPHLTFRCFGVDKMMLIVPKKHSWARRQSVSLREFAKQPLILREVGSGSRSCLERAMTKAGMSLGESRIALELGSNEAIKEAVLRGMGAAVLSTQAVRKEVRTGQLHALRITGLCLQREMFAAWDRRRVLPIPARLFLDVLGTNTPRITNSYQASTAY